MKSTCLICGEDSDEEFRELRALIERKRGNLQQIASELDVSVDLVRKKLKEHGLLEAAKQEALESKMRFRLPQD